MAVVSRCLRAAILSSCALITGAHAQSLPTPDFVVTPTRTLQAISRAGSAITVITAEEIAKESPRDITKLLRRVPGLTLTQTGGVGAATSVRLRGAEDRHTLVLIDGVRVNDPSVTGNVFDFAQLVPTDIERIEVLRGPQSALYGSDAIGGVIHIITRKGKGAPRGFAGTEAGSYGSKGLRAGVSGGTGPLSYAFSLSGYDMAGFSQYGYRIGRIERQRAFPLEADAARRVGATGRIGVALGEDIELEFGGYASSNAIAYDAVSGTLPDSPSKAEQRLYEGHSRLTALTLDGLLRHTVLLSASRTDRHYRDVYAYPDFFTGESLVSLSRSQYEGARIAAEYQGDLKLGILGLLTFGTRIERETLHSRFQPILPTPFDPDRLEAGQITRSLFAIHQISLWQNLHLSFSGRLDDVQDGDRFATWRTTVAYEIPESGTIVRASLGTGAKAPSLFQRFAPSYGTPDLESERSFGGDIGLDQRLLDDRLTLSATYFANRFHNLIEFSFDPDDCGLRTPFQGCYVNRLRAESSGIELAATVDMIPGWLKLRAAYTHLQVIDKTPDPVTGAVRARLLPRRPKDEAWLGFTFTPIAGLSIEPSLILVGTRRSGFDEAIGYTREVKLPPYARLDLNVDYRIDDTFSIFARAENLTDAKYEEVYNYGTAGRSFYAGLRATW